MKTILILVSICIFYISTTNAQSLIYDKARDQTNYFNMNGKFIGYSKQNNNIISFYDPSGIEIPFNVLTKRYISKDDGTDLTVGDLLKEDPIILPKQKESYSEYKTPEPKIISAKWNEIYKRWDYKYGY